MSDYIFSPKQNAFYPLSLKEDYELAGSWPDDGVPVTEEVFKEYTAQPPSGKIRGAVNNAPAWLDAPAPTHEEMVSEAERKKAELRKNADDEIAWRQDAVDTDIATESEITELAAWKKYRVLLMRVDTTKAPEIKWPDKPQ